tara:strand:- start:436 stop:900 length:465 start_codon:yes stop_codon:yes gene_type:complete
VKTYKQRLLDNLRNDTYCRLGVSNLQGVGVFAIKEIPKGVNPFKKTYIDTTPQIDITDEDLEGIDENVAKCVKDFFAKDEFQSYPVSLNGLNCLDISFYVNHSNDPNLTINEKSPQFDQYSPFVATRLIKEGEELTQDYVELYNNDPSQFKEIR